MAVIKDVAKLAGVSVGTVSKYLNNPQNLKDDTRAKVEDAIRQLQYQPSPLARSMRTGKTNTIAVIAPDIVNPFFAEIYDSIRMASVNSGYTPILYTTEDNPETLKAYLTDISARQLDGIILCFIEEDDLILNFVEKMQNQIPIVLFSWDICNTRFNCISIDIFEGVFKSTGHLISIGRKDIAYVGGHKENRISREKYNGYLKAMNNAGLNASADLEHYGDFKLNTGYFAARKFLMLNRTPDAIVAENDVLAIGCMKYLIQRGVRIPDDIAVIGFDNISIASMYEPSLSTIALPILKMGEEALKLLISVMEKRSTKNRLVIMKTDLFVRCSTDKNAPVELNL
jgi:DNA-binding LacI/PurR family transcriptional regulator